jgi:hypothetical protein
MVAEASENIRTKASTIYVREDWFHFFRKIKKNKNVKQLPPLPYSGNTKADNPNNWGSGAYAVLLAAMNFDRIFLLGFDLWGSSSYVNNVYKDTSNYSNKDKPAVDPSFWIYQISKVFRLFPGKQFVILNNNNWKMPDEWKLQNVSFTNLHNFEY